MDSERERVCSHSPKMEKHSDPRQSYVNPSYEQSPKGNSEKLIGSGLYTDESPGLKVDPVVVMTLSVVFIFSVVALHGMRPLVHLKTFF
jgi:hypothetical protein